MTFRIRNILYEIVSVRIAVAQFGVTTAIVSMVLSVFMGGLGLGSWGAEILIRFSERFEQSAGAWGTSP